MSSPTTDTRGGSAPGDLEPEDYPRKVLFVAGAGRSGTSTMAGPHADHGPARAPARGASPTSPTPRASGSPRWVVEHHDRLLKEALRPGQRRPARRLVRDRPRRRPASTSGSRTAEWLESHFAGQPRAGGQGPAAGLVPRPVAGRRGPHRRRRRSSRPCCGRRAEVVGSKQTYYANRLGSAHLAASWLNMLLHTERGTRESVADGGRVFVRYGDLLDDWVKVVDARRRDARAPARAARQERADPRRPPVRRPRAAPDDPDPRADLQPAAAGCTS